MAKCFFTGIESPAQEMFVLDAAAARRAVRDLRQRLAAVERLLLQLNAKDDAEVYDFKTHKPITIKEYRLVSATVAEALSASYPWTKLFMTWNEWRDRRLAFRQMSSRNDQTDLHHSTSAGSNEGGAA
jgi:hypothetical protein